MRIPNFQSRIHYPISPIKGGCLFPFVTEKGDDEIFNTFVEYVKKADYRPDRKNLVVLNAGCGLGTDTKCLVSYFGKKKFGEFGDDVCVYGVDKKEKDISFAKERNKHLGKSAVFIDDFISNAIEKNTNLKNNIDVVVIRHPNVHESLLDLYLSGNSFDFDKTRWPKTINACHQNLRNGGIMIITTLDNDEMSLVRRATHGFIKKVDEPNSTDYMLDRHIMIIKK